MTVKKIWMPPTSGRKNRYAVTTLGSILGIALLMLLLIAGGITLSFALSLPREVTAVVLCLGVTLLGVGAGFARRAPLGAGGHRLFPHARR